MTAEVMIDVMVLLQSKQCHGVPASPGSRERAQPRFPIGASEKDQSCWLLRFGPQPPGL